MLTNEKCLEELMKEFRNDKYLQKLANIYVDNCGISISNRSVAFDVAVDYFEKKYQIIALEDVVDYFNLLMDEIDVSHRNYDITLNIPDEKYERIKKELIEFS